jgi:hypothetical protein
MNEEVDGARAVGGGQRAAGREEEEVEGTGARRFRVHGVRVSRRVREEREDGHAEERLPGRVRQRIEFPVTELPNWSFSHGWKKEAVGERTLLNPYLAKHVSSQRSHVASPLPQRGLC